MREMKESGIPWIGAIPSSWSVIRIKDACWLKGRIGWDGLKSSEYLDEGPYLITGTDFYNGSINWSSCVHISNERFDQDSDIHIQEDDLLITKDGTVGKVAVVNNCPEKVSLNSGVLLVRNTKEIKYHQKYLYYVLLSPQFWIWYELNQTGNSTIRHLYQEQFYNFSFSFPSILEQKSISDFLDRKCANIDSVLEKTKESIEEYKKLKQSVITEAVSKGIRGKRPMKDSGIEWIRKLPAEWTPINPKALFSQRKDKAIKGERQLAASQNHGIIYQDDYMALTGAKVVTVEKDFDILKHVEKGDFVISMRSFQGGLEYSENTGSISSAYVMIIPKPEYVHDRYYRWLFKSQIYIDALRSTSNMVRDGQAMRYSNFAQVRLFKVPLEEQVEIAEYLDRKCPEIDTLIEAKEKFIKELEAYKKSLIFEYVTGKRAITE